MCVLDGCVLHEKELVLRPVDPKLPEESGEEKFGCSLGARKFAQVKRVAAYWLQSAE